MAATMKSMQTMTRPTVARRVSRASTVKPQALATSMVISGATASMLAIGRLVFLPYQRRTQSNAVGVAGPKTTGTTPFDDLQKDSTFIMNSNDPAGFNMIDVFGWGALGHALGFAVLAISSLHEAGVNPWPSV